MEFPELPEKIGGIGRIYGYNQRVGKDYKWYISGIYTANWVTYHLLREPETAIHSGMEYILEE